MTLEDAIERVEEGLDWIRGQLAIWQKTSPGATETKLTETHAQALTLVLAAAKRPYALSDLDRIALRRLEYAGEELTRDHHHEGDAWCPDCEETAAVTAALALEKPEEPFTVEELEYLQTAVGAFDPTGYEDCTWELFEAVSAKLNAYLESLPQESAR